MGLFRRAKNSWFREVRGSHLPQKWQGWLLYLPYIFLLIIGLYGAWHYTHIIGFTALIFLPWAVACAATFEWLASRL